MVAEGDSGGGYKAAGGLEPAGPPAGALGSAAVSADMGGVAFGLLVDGDGMAPDFPHGSVAMCGPWQDGGAAMPGRFYVLDLAGRPGRPGGPYLFALAGGTADAVFVRLNAAPGRTLTVARADVVRFAPVLAVQIPKAGPAEYNRTDDRGRLVCPHCGRAYVRPGMFGEHVRSVHGVEPTTGGPVYRRPKPAAG